VAVPGAARAARANRTFLARAVQFLGREAGIRQFLDVGTGLPTRGNVHEIAQIANPQAHVLYTDIDPMVVVHASALLANSLTVAATQADLRQPEHLFTMPVTRTLIDISQPLGVLLVAILHFLPDNDNPWALVDEIKRKLAPGSYVVISHVTADEIPAGVARQAAEVYRHALAPGVARSRDDIARFFSGLDMVAPGLVDVAAWQPPTWPGNRVRPCSTPALAANPCRAGSTQVDAMASKHPPAVAGS
jgi:SAM-dependent methyltransferase